MTKSVDAIRQLFDKLNNGVGKLPAMPDIVRDYPASFVRRSESERELVMMR